MYQLEYNCSSLFANGYYAEMLIQTLGKIKQITVTKFCVKGDGNFELI